MMFMSFKVMGVILLAVLVGLWVMPDFVFFPLVAVGAIVGGIYMLGRSAAWGVGLIVLGVLLSAWAVKCIIDASREEDDEAEKAAGEVSKRFGSVYEPKERKR